MTAAAPPTPRQWCWRALLQAVWRLLWFAWAMTADLIFRALSLVLPRHPSLIPAAANATAVLTYGSYCNGISAPSWDAVAVALDATPAPVCSLSAVEDGTPILVLEFQVYLTLASATMALISSLIGIVIAAVALVIGECIQVVRAFLIFLDLLYSSCPRATRCLEQQRRLS